MTSRFSFNSFLLVAFVLSVPALTVAHLGDIWSETRSIPSYVLPEVVVSVSAVNAPDVAAAEVGRPAQDRRPS